MNCTSIPGYVARVAPIIALLALGACSSGNDDAPSSSAVAVRFSDAPVDALSQVVVTVDRITFRRGGSEDDGSDVGDESNDEPTDETAPVDGDSADIVVDRFTSAELGIEDAESFTIDLLDVQGDDNRLVLDSVTLPVGQYSDLRLHIVDEDLNASYVEETDGSDLKALKVPSGELKLGAFEVLPLSTQTFVIEFGLRQSMTYNPGPDRYILKPRGVRIVQLEQAAAIEGSVDLIALHARAPCDAKADSNVGAAVYLYTGHDLDPASLADDFDPALAGDTENMPAAPHASAALSEDGGFILAYLEPGDYTIAASCEAANDDADTLDAALTVPAPSDQLVEVTLGHGERQACTFGTPTPACAAVVDRETFYVTPSI